MLRTQLAFQIAVLLPSFRWCLQNNPMEDSGIIWTEWSSTLLDPAYWFTSQKLFCGDIWCGFIYLQLGQFSSMVIVSMLRFAFDMRPAVQGWMSNCYGKLSWFSSTLRQACHFIYSAPADVLIEFPVRNTFKAFFSSLEKQINRMILRFPRSPGLDVGTPLNLYCGFPSFQYYPLFFCAAKNFHQTSLDSFLIARSPVF